LLIAAPLIFLVAILAATELGGEVVELETYDANGTRFVTSLWAVDLDGDVWLRAGDPTSGWVQRLKETPRAKLTRYGQKLEVEGLFIEDYAPQINREMRRKYGIADRIVGVLHEEDAVLAIRLIDPQA
jgi:hypothetical protein